MYERYTGFEAVTANTHNLPAHDAVMLAGATLGGRTDLIMFKKNAPRGTNGRVMNPDIEGTFGNTGPILTFHGAGFAGSTYSNFEIIPVQIKGVGPIFGHTVFLLTK